MDRFVSFPGLPGWLVRPVRRARDKYHWFDTMVLAAVRFDQVNGGRLAAAISYYAFLAAFPLLLLSFSVLGFVLNEDALLTLKVESFLQQNVPGLPVTAIADARNTAGVLGVLGFLYAGLRWVDAIRSSVRAVWRRNEGPGNFFGRRVIDLLALLGLGAALLLSVGATIVVSQGANWFLDLIGQQGRPIGDTTLSVLGFLAGLVVDAVAFVGFLCGLPRLKMSVRRAWGPVLLGALGLELLKTVGRVYINHTASNSAYTVVASTVGLLVFFQLFDQLLLYCAALTACAKRGGRVLDRIANARPVSGIPDDRRAALAEAAQIADEIHSEPEAAPPDAEPVPPDPDRAPAVAVATAPPGRPDTAADGPGAAGPGRAPAAGL
jgi:membrane protein